MRSFIKSRNGCTEARISQSKQIESQRKRRVRAREDSNLTDPEHGKVVYFKNTATHKVLYLPESACACLESAIKYLFSVREDMTSGIFFLKDRKHKFNFIEGEQKIMVDRKIYEGRGTRVERRV